MSKAVLISIQPKWCELIANGKKTIEVRKTKPKLETPFKCYIYCTKPSKKHQTICGCMVLNDDELYRHPKQGIKYGDSIELMFFNSDEYSKDNFLNGKVIGEFVCDTIDEIALINTPIMEYIQVNGKASLTITSDACMNIDALSKYADGKQLYGWHISDLKIYDEPKELASFKIEDKHRIQRCAARERVYNNPDFNRVEFEAVTNEAWLNGAYYCNKYNDFCNKCLTKELTRPPRSWCYVEHDNPELLGGESK